MKIYVYYNSTSDKYRELFKKRLSELKEWLCFHSDAHSICQSRLIKMHII